MNQEAEKLVDRAWDIWQAGADYETRCKDMEEFVSPILDALYHARVRNHEHNDACFGCSEVTRILHAWGRI